MSRSLNKSKKPVCVLGYGRNETRIISHIESLGYCVEVTSEPVEDFSGFETVISFGYRHILREHHLRSLQRPVLNLHISYLPYNRGAHPNFWSFIEDTPAGVTIHEIDSGIDTGPICFQEKLQVEPAGLTFRDSYNQLKVMIESLFCRHAVELISGEYEARAQVGAGTFHKARDLPGWVDWDMEITKAKARYNSQRPQGQENPLR